jgi:DNA polymerase-3 subunit delta
MKLPAARIAAFLKSPDAALRAFLVFGPDGGLVRERADGLARHIVADPNDPFRVTDLTAALVTSDPARLHDEMAAQSLTGGRRLVRVREAGDAAAAVLDRLLRDPPPGDSGLVVDAGDLPTRSALRKLFEGSPLAVAIPCYADGPRELEQLVRDVLGSRGITVSDDAKTYLVAHLGGDRQVSRQELEKLALYAGDGGRVGREEAMASVGDTAALTLDDVIQAAADGDAAGLERALFRAFEEGEAPVTILRAALRHLQRLHLAGSAIAAGAGTDDAVGRLRPPLFFKAKDRFKRQLRLWPPRRAAPFLSALLEAERNTKRTGLPAETICRDVLLRMARLAMAAARQ